MKIDDVFRKLRPVMGAKLDRLWQEYVIAGPEVRQEIERVLRIELGQRLGETFQSSQMLLKPPPGGLASGDYPAGRAFYADKGCFLFGVREPREYAEIRSPPLGDRAPRHAFNGHRGHSSASQLLVNKRVAALFCGTSLATAQVPGRRFKAPAFFSAICACHPWRRRISLR
jgi:hypothetical protein